MPCALCPRHCKVDRESQSGFCRASRLPKVAKVMLHRWEEPCICYEKGSGAIFFSGCQMQCVFCQNHLISCSNVGTEVDAENLVDLFFRLEEAGACNINLVSPTPHLNTLIPALEKARGKGLRLPTLFNSGGYESVETLRRLEGLIDIYLPDFKFFDSGISSSFAQAPDYAAVAVISLKEMVRQCPRLRWDKDRLLGGVIVRHLVLPGHTDDSEKVLHTVKQTVESDNIILSLMRQYTPMHRAKEFPSLSRPITSLEYTRVTRLAEKLRFSHIYTQGKESATEDFVPVFDGNLGDFLDKK